MRAWKWFPALALAALLLTSGVASAQPDSCDLEDAERLLRIAGVVASTYGTLAGAAGGPAGAAGGAVAGAVTGATLTLASLTLDELGGDAACPAA